MRPERVGYPDTNSQQISDSSEEDYSGLYNPKGRGAEASQSRGGKGIIKLVWTKGDAATTCVFLAGEPKLS